MSAVEYKRLVALSSMIDWWVSVPFLGVWASFSIKYPFFHHFIESLRLQNLNERWKDAFFLIMRTRNDLFWSQSRFWWVYSPQHWWHIFFHGCQWFGNFYSLFQTTFIRDRYDKLEMEENPDKILSGIVENCKIANPQCDNMAAILIFLKKGELKAWRKS